MEEEGERMHGSFTSTMTLTQIGVPHVPQCYVLPPSERPNHSFTLPSPTTLPFIDLSSLHHPSLRSPTIEEVRMACKEIGFFQVINHGIPPWVMKDALDTATEFFNLPIEEKMAMASDDVHQPVRYGTSQNHVREKVHFWRDFIKQYCHPISNWIHLWPSTPPSYKEKMGNYAVAVQVLQKQLMELVLESLGLNPNYLQQEIEEGSQVMAINCYPPCPEPELTLGLPSHTDHGTLTILLQGCPGLQLMNHHNKEWIPVPMVEGALIVQLGDQMEVMSNGLYKSVVHRAMVSSDKQRISIASIHSLPMGIKVRPAMELVDEEHPLSYREYSFSDFLHFMSSNDITKGRFIDTLKMNP